MADVQIFKCIFPQIEKLAKLLIIVNTIFFNSWKDKHCVLRSKNMFRGKTEMESTMIQWLINKSLRDTGVGLLFEAGMREGVEI